MRFGTQARVSALVAGMFVVLLAALAGLQSFQRAQSAMLFRDRAQQLSGVLDRCIATDQGAYMRHVDDYSRWDEMVRCVRKRDTRWAEINIRPSLAVFDVDVLWVLDPDLRTVYTATRLAHAPLTPPADTTSFLRDLAVRPFRHWFASTPDGVMELWTAPIQPSEDAARSTTAQGYYAVGRYWDRHVLGDLSSLVGGRASLLPAGDPASPPRASARDGIIDLDRVFGDLQGHAVATMRFTTHYPSFEAVESDGRGVRQLLLLLAALCVLGMYAAIHGWVVRPLQRLQAAMRHEDPTRLGGMVEGGDEFGRLAALIRDFFAQRETMVREVEVRRAAERDAAAQRDFVRRVLDADPNAIYVVDGLGRIVFANDSAHRVLGAEPGTLPGRRVDDVLGPLGVAVSFHRSRALAMQTWEPQAIEELLTAPDGGVRRLQSVRSPLQRMDGEAHVLTISVDVTARGPHVAAPRAVAGPAADAAA
jgi:PAS domain S-box-containing protein